MFTLRKLLNPGRRLLLRATIGKTKSPGSSPPCQTFLHGDLDHTKLPIIPLQDSL